VEIGSSGVIKTRNLALSPCAGRVDSVVCPPYTLNRSEKSRCSVENTCFPIFHDKTSAQSPTTRFDLNARYFQIALNGKAPVPGAHPGIVSSESAGAINRTSDQFRADSSITI
jgi:hypothetical protein